MKHPSLEEQAEYIRKWAKTWRTLDEMRCEKLRGIPLDWREVDALLQLGDNCGLPSRTTNGMIDMQRLFMKLKPGVDDGASPGSEGRNEVGEAS